MAKNKRPISDSQLKVYEFFFVWAGRAILMLVSIIATIIIFVNLFNPDTVSADKWKYSIVQAGIFIGNRYIVRHFFKT